MSEVITQLYCSESSLIGSCNNLLLIFGKRTPTGADFAALGRIGSDMIRRWPAGIAVMVCTRAGAKPPDQEQRTEMQATIKRLSPGIRAMAWVVLGEGFMSAAVRSIFSALNLALRTDYPTKVFSDIPTGVAWSAAQVEGKDGVRFDRAALSTRARELAADSVRPPAASV